MNDRFAVALKAIVLVAALAIGAAVAADAAEAPGPHTPSITVSGTAEVAAAPDRAQLTVGAVAEARQAQDAQRQIAAGLQRVVKDIRALGIPEEKIRSTGLSLTPVYAQPGPKPAAGNEGPRIVGYRAADSLRVQIEPVDRVGAVVDAAIGAGANQMGGLVFELRNDLACRRQALQGAVQEARAKAEAIAAAMNLALGEVIDVREEGAHAPYPAERRFAAPAAAGTPVQPGQIQVAASVTVRYRLVAAQR
jgi:uncharacterized protein YggE